MTKINRLLPAWSLKEAETGGPMTFITGPRQAGKTFLVKNFSDRYFNWDTSEVKKAFLKDPYFFRDDSEKNRIVIFDEIHKKRNWKILMKGYYDSPSRNEDFIVTGSGRFDQYVKGGDSLQGRYFSYKLWPITYDEILGAKNATPPRNFSDWDPGIKNKSKNLEELITFGGFPETFLKGREQFTRKWNDMYLQRLVHEDIRDFATTQNLDKIELLARLLPDRLTSPISHKSLGEDIEVSPITIKSWLRLLETLYLGFFVPPFHQKIHRAVKREQKWYFYQWTMTEAIGAKFENFMAVQLSATCSAWREQGHGRYELFYLRDQDKREVDFLIAKDLKPQCIIEIKAAPSPWPSGLNYYANKLKIPAYLIYPEGPTRKIDNGIAMSADLFLKGLIGN